MHSLFDDSAVEDSIEGLWQTDPSIKAQLLVNDSIIQNLDSIYFLNDSLLHTGLSFNDSMAIILTDSLKADSLGSYAHINDSLVSWINVAQQAKIATALSKNAGMSSPSYIESSEQNVNEIYLQTIAQNISTFSTSQLSTLRSIASQCPYVYGTAVFKARSLLALVDTTVYDDSTLCTVQSRKMQVKQTASRQQSVSAKLYPNPSTGIVTVAYQLSGGEGTLQIFDVVGQMLAEFKLDGSKTTMDFDISKLCCGAFEYRISETNGATNYGKFIIIR